MNSTDRLLQFIDYKRISKREFYNTTGLSNGFLDKTSNIGADKLEKIISAYPELNLYYVVGLDSEMIKAEREVLKHTFTPSETSVVNEPIGMYETVTPTSKTGVSAAKTAPPTAPANNKIGVKEVYLTPHIITVDAKENKENIVYVPIRAAAGYLNGYADPVFMEKLPSFNMPGLQDGTYRAFEVSGDSMWPTLENKEMVIGQWVEKLDYIREDRVHIIVTKTEGVIVKRLLNRIDKYGYIIAKSDAVNDRNLYPNINIHPEDILEIWYAVWHGGFNFKAPGDLWRRQNNLEADLTDVLRRLQAAGL